MSSILENLGAALGTIYLQKQGVPIAISSTGTAINYYDPVQASQVGSSNPAMSVIGSTPTPATTGGMPLGDSPVAKDVKGLGRWGLALVGFLGVLMFLKPREAGILALTVVLGALVVNAETAKKAGRPTVIQTVLGG